MTFRSSILAGVNLIRAAIQSPNYTPGVSGWIIRQDGSAEFHTVVITAGSLLEMSAVNHTDPVMTADVVADAFARFVLLADGTLSWGPGNVTADTNLFRAGPADLKTDSGMHIGQNLTVLGTLLTLATAGAKLAIKEGTNAGMGVATLAAGTVTVPTNTINANSRVLLTAQSTGAAPGALRVSARSPGVSFTITSTSATDTSSVAWVIIDPAP